MIVCRRQNAVLSALFLGPITLDQDQVVGLIDDRSGAFKAEFPNLLVLILALPDVMHEVDMDAKASSNCAQFLHEVLLRVVVVFA